MTDLLVPTTSPLDRDLRNAIRDLAARRLSIDEFEDWFVPATWNVAVMEPDVAPLVYAVELRLAEHGLGHLPLVQLETDLRVLADTYRQPPTVVTSTATRRAQRYLVLAG